MLGVSREPLTKHRGVAVRREGVERRVVGREDPAAGLCDDPRARVLGDVASKPREQRSLAAEKLDLALLRRAHAELDHQALDGRGLDRIGPATRGAGSVALERVVEVFAVDPAVRELFAKPLLGEVRLGVGALVRFANRFVKRLVLEKMEGVVVHERPDRALRRQSVSKMFDRVLEGSRAVTRWVRAGHDGCRCLRDESSNERTLGSMQPAGQPMSAQRKTSSASASSLKKGPEARSSSLRHRRSGQG